MQEEDMRKRIPIFILVILTLFLAVILIAGEEHSYVSAKTCKMCHKGEKKAMCMKSGKQANTRLPRQT